MAGSRRSKKRSQSMRWIVIVALLVVALAVTAGVVGCRRQKPQPVTQQPPVTQPATSTEEPTTEPEPETTETVEPSQPDVVDVGPLHVPQPGTDERQELADAARKLLDTESRFVINQMWSDDAWAIAQLTPKEGGASKFVAYRHEPDGWVAIWSGPVPGDGTASIKELDDRFESEVTSAIKWKGVSTSETTPASRPSNADAIAAAKAFAKSNGPDVKITGAELLGMTKDSKGRWWAWVLVKGPANVDPLTVYEYKTGGSWKLWDFGSEPKPVPSDVDF